MRTSVPEDNMWPTKDYKNTKYLKTFSFIRGYAKYLELFDKNYTNQSLPPKNKRIYHIIQHGLRTVANIFAQYFKGAFF